MSPAFRAPAWLRSPTKAGPALALALLTALSACPAKKETKTPTATGGAPLVVNEAPPLPVAEGKITARILLDAQSVGATEAALSTLEITAGTAIPPHVHPGAAEVLYLLEGEGELVASSHRERVGPGDAILLPAGVPHSFTAGAKPVRIVQLYAPGGPEQRFRGQGSAGTIKPEESQKPDPGGTKLIPASAIPTKDSPGGAKVRAYFEDTPLEGASLSLLSVREPAGADPGVHDHPDVSELVYVAQGEGAAVQGGKELPVKTGGAYYTPRGAAAGFRPAQESELIVFVLGSPTN
jgi:quercetin dioxygenase-like cupin family protein